MLKRLARLLPLFLFFVFAKETFALVPETFVTVSNPVRGWDNWLLQDQTPLDLPKYQLQEASRSGLPVTWLLRFDALNDASISAYFSNLINTNNTQFLGAFLEVTSSLTDAANLGYIAGETPYSANRVFLSGYSQTDRIKIIDTYMSTFFNRFGFYPKSVSAWHLDSFSLNYLQTKYSVLTAMNNDEQFSIEGNRLWGGYMGSPYYPDKNNSLVPAQSQKNRVNLAMVRWNQRDLFNYYGTGLSSNFQKLLALYSQHDFNEITYLNTGLENDYPLAQYRQEITNTYDTIIKNKELYGLHITNLSDFGDLFKARYPESSPAYFYRTSDPSGNELGEVIWYQNPYFRIGLKSVDGKTKIIDLRVYNREIYEDDLITQNHQSDLYVDTPAVIDSVKYPGTEVTLDIDINDFKTVYDRQWDLWQISLEKDNQRITFYPDSITFTNISVPLIKSQDLKVTKTKNQVTWNMTPHTPFKDTLKYSWVLWIVLAFVIITIIRKVRKNGPPKISLPIIVGSLCVAAITITLLKNSLPNSFGLGFWGPNGHDAIFHLSLIEKFSRNPLSFNHPQYLGAKLTNYHLVFDYLSGIFIHIFNIPSTTFYFRITPILFGGLLLFLLNKLLSRWHFSSREKIFSFIFVFLGGSLGFIPKIITGQDIFSGESAFWVNQSASLFLNPPFVLSLIFLLLFLLNLPEDDNPKFKQLLLLVFLGAILSQTKVYAFALLIAALFLCRKIKLFTGVAILGAVFTLPFSSFSGSPFLFEPLWFSRSMFASYDRFFWPEMASAWQAYEATGNIPKLLAVNLFATVIFFVGNLGVRLFGLFDLIKLKSKDLSEKIVFWIIIIGLLIPLFIVQKGNPWNTIQFTYYSIFFLGLFTGKAVSRLIPSQNPTFFKILLVIFIFALGTFTSVGTLKDYLGERSNSSVGYSEMGGLETLRKQPYGIVVTPFYYSSGLPSSPIPLYDYTSTAYVSALSGQPEYLSDTINLEITGIDFKERSKEVQRLYNTTDASWAKNYLVENNIKYIYNTPLHTIKVKPGDLSLTLIFDSGGFRIYKTN